MSYSNNWEIDEVTGLTSLKDCYLVGNTKSILKEVGCPRLAIIDDNWNGKGNIDTSTSVYKNFNEPPFVSYGDLQFYAIPNFLVSDKYISAYGFIKEDNEDDNSFKWKRDIIYNNNNRKNEKEKWNYNYVPIVLLDNLTTYNYLKHYDINIDNDSVFAIMEYNKQIKTEIPSIKIIPVNTLKYVYSATEKDLHISKNTTNISTYSFINGSVSGHNGTIYRIDYNTSNGFSCTSTSDSADRIKGDLVRIEYIYTLNPKTDSGLVDENTLVYEQEWPILNENEQNKLEDRFLNSILFSDMKREIYRTGRTRPVEELFQPIDLINPSQAYWRYGNNFSWNFFGSIPQGLRNIGLKYNQQDYWFSSPIIWKYERSESTHTILFNLNRNEAISAGYEVTNVAPPINYIIGQTVFLNVPKYEWLFSSTRSFEDEKEHFVSNYDYYFESGTVYGESKIKAHQNHYLQYEEITSRSQITEVARRHTVCYKIDTGPNYIADESASTVSFPTVDNTLYNYYRVGTLSSIKVIFPLKGTENRAINTSDYVGYTTDGSSIINGWLKKKIEEEIAGETVTTKELNWFGDPYYILDAEGKDVTNEYEGGEKVNHRHGVYSYSSGLSSQRGIYITSDKNPSYGLAVNFDFTLSASSNIPNRSAVVGLTTEPFWFEYNYDNCTYSLRSSISDYRNLLPVTASFKFYVYNKDNNNYEWYTKDIEINNEVQIIEINDNNRLVITGTADMPIWEDVSGQVTFEEVGSLIRIDSKDYYHAKYLKIGDEFPLPVGIKGVKDSTNFEVNGINTETSTLIYSKTEEDGEYRRDWDLYAKIIDDKLVLYGRDSGDDGGYSWDDEWEDFEIGFDVQELLFYIKGVLDWEVKIIQNNTEVWKRTGFETGYVSLLLYETKAQSIVKCKDVGTKTINGITYKAEKLVSSTSMPPRVWSIHYKDYGATITETTLSLDDLQADTLKELPHSGIVNSTYIYIDSSTNETFLLDKTGRGIEIYGWRTYKIES